MNYPELHNLESAGVKPRTELERRQLTCLAFFKLVVHLQAGMLPVAATDNHSESAAGRLRILIDQANSPYSGELQAELAQIHSSLIKPIYTIAENLLTEGGTLALIGTDYLQILNNWLAPISGSEDSELAHEVMALVYSHLW